MSRSAWWGIFAGLALIALGVQLMWLLIMMDPNLNLSARVIILLLVFPGGIGWVMPLGFAYFWRDERRHENTQPGAH